MNEPVRKGEVPVLTEIVQDEHAPRRAVDDAALEALARALERAVLERLGPEVDRVIEERLARTLNSVLGQAVESVRAEITVSVTQMLDKLPERYRQAVTLFYMEDKSYEQTGESLGLPLGTVKALLHRARKRLIELTRESESASDDV